MTQPSTEWTEKITAAEPECFAHETETLSAIQQDRTHKYGQSGRGFHRKPLLALRGRFEVLPDLPPYARFGLFSRPGSHEVWIRTSNGTFDIQADSIPDIRGFALKVFGVEGPDARDGSPAWCQDFLMIQIDPFGLTSEQFTALSAQLANGDIPPSPEAAQRLAISGFATTTFNTTTPFTVGPYAARARLLPPEGEVPDPDADNDWAADMFARLPLTYRFQLQFYVNESDTPIEDATKQWPEASAPWVTVADLTIPEQQLGAGFAAQVEQISFAPWNALADHRPLGEVNRARRVAMDRSVADRNGTYTVAASTP
ncbi:hypothetical protein [Nocardia sp. NPDC006630]|uniref:hypothetical protein n=1 Tax=Nocardia sp. NPDC006630 TaxID=3157181 RepID=UPI0033BCDA2A